MFFTLQTLEQAFERHITITSENSNAITELEKVCSLSRAQLKTAIDKGALWLTKGVLSKGSLSKVGLSKGKSTQRFRRIKKTLSVGDILHFYYNAEVLSQSVNEALLIKDSVDYSVWFKPFGMMSQGSKWSDHCTISRWVQKYFKSERNVFIVHRLDKAATGLIIIAHTKKAAQGFSTLFEHHNLDKYYHIITHGHFNKGVEPLCIDTPIAGKKAVSHFTLLNYNVEKNQSLIEVKIETGRKHQIRIHASSMGYSVVGDRLHGDALAQAYIEAKLETNIAHSLENNTINLQLCAVQLRFTCPISNDINTIILPDELRPHL